VLVSNLVLLCGLLASDLGQHVWAMTVYGLCSLAVLMARKQKPPGERYLPICWSGDWILVPFVGKGHVVFDEHRDLKSALICYSPAAIWQRIYSEEEGAQSGFVVRRLGACGIP